MPSLNPTPVPAESSTRVVMFTAPNPGPKTLDGTHTFVAGTRPAVLIDPGPAIDDYTDALTAWLQANDIHVRAILLSHQHPDHAPGAERLRDRLHVPVWASPAYETTIFDPVEPDFTYSPGQEFPVDEEVLRVVDTPGHSRDHVAFWLEESRVLFTGDTILGTGTSLVAPPEGDMARYLASLRSLAQLDPQVIAPGHGPLVLDPARTIAGYLRHRADRESQILRALESGPQTIAGLVLALYADVDPRLHELAAGSVAAHLHKLESESRVSRHDDDYSLTDINITS